MDRNASLEDLRKAYFVLAKRTHPDAGGEFGDSDAFLKLTAAFQAAVRIKEESPCSGACKGGEAESTGMGGTSKSMDGSGEEEKRRLWLERQNSLRDFFSQEKKIKREGGGRVVGTDWGDEEVYINLYKRRLSEERAMPTAGTTLRSPRSSRANRSGSCSTEPSSEAQDTISEAAARDMFLRELGEFGLPLETSTLYYKETKPWARRFHRKSGVNIPFALTIASILLAAGVGATHILFRGSQV